MIPWWRDIRSRRWILVAVALKLALYGFLIWEANKTGTAAALAHWERFGSPHETHDPTRFTPFLHQGDEWSYVNPIENLLTRAQYIADVQQPDSRAGRMPGYGFTYLAFRIFFSANLAKTLLIWLQVLLSGLSLYCLARLGAIVFQRRAMFYLVFALYGLSVFVSVWDMAMMTESLAASSLIFFLYLLLRADETGSRVDLVAAGFFYAYLVFLRPFTAPLILLAVPVVWKRGVRDWRAVAQSAVAFALCITVFEGAWVVRNYRIFGRLVPFQVNTYAGYRDMPGDAAVRKWLQTVGAEIFCWDPKLLAGWLRKDCVFHDESYQVPSHVFTSRYGLRELDAARQVWNQALQETDLARKQALDEQARAAFDGFTASYRSDKRLSYLFVSPLRIMKGFLVTAGPVLPFKSFSELRHDLPALGFKLLTVFLYWTILITGFLGLFAILRSRDHRVWIAVAPFPAILILFTFILRLSERRFFTSAYPSLCLLSALFLTRFLPARWRQTSDERFGAAPEPTGLHGKRS